MEFKSAEDAYMALASYIQAFINDRLWDEAGCSMKTYENMAQGSHWLIYDGAREKKGGFDDKSPMWNGLDAAIFLRDNLLSTTGERIWGLTFTLYPDGKFNIEYDYNKPEDYEESDEVITGDEMNQGLNGLLK